MNWLVVSSLAASSIALWVSDNNSDNIQCYAVRKLPVVLTKGDPNGWVVVSKKP